MTDPTPRPGRWKTVALVLSLGLNLALVGLIVGVAIRGPGGAFGVPVDGFRTVVRAMNEDDRRAVIREIRGRGDDLRSARTEMRDMRRDFLALLRAQDFSRPRLEALFQRQSAVLQGLGGEAQAILVERIAQMSPDERAAMADRLEEQMRKGWGRRERHGR